MSEVVESAPLPFKCKQNVRRCSCLPVCMLGVSISISNEVLDEHFQDRTSFIVNEADIRITPARRANFCNGAKGNRYVSFRCGVEEAMSWALGKYTWNYKQN